MMKQYSWQSRQTLIIIIALLFSVFDAHAACATMTNSCAEILRQENCCARTASGAGHCPSPMPAATSDCTDAGAVAANPLWLSCKWDYNTNSCGWSHPQ